MANNRFAKFSRRQEREFDIDLSIFRDGTMTAEDLYEEDGDSTPHTVLAVWRHAQKPEVLAQYPNMPDHNYTVGLMMQDGTAAYVFVPATMVEDFDSIMADPSLIKEIKRGNCSMCAYSFSTKQGTRYGLDFC